jgi:hypothetical protein
MDLGPHSRQPSFNQWLPMLLQPRLPFQIPHQPVLEADPFQVTIALIDIKVQ